MARKNKAKKAAIPGWQDVTFPKRLEPQTVVPQTLPALPHTKRSLTYDIVLSFFMVFVVVLGVLLLKRCTEDKPKPYEKICLEGHVYFYTRTKALAPKFDAEGKPVNCKGKSNAPPPIQQSDD